MMGKPLKPLLQNTVNTLPIDEIRRSIGNAILEFSSPARERRELRPVEWALVSSLSQYWTADKSQLTQRNLFDVFIYLDFAFGGPGTAGLTVPDTFDWSLIDRFAPSQISAALGLFSAFDWFSTAGEDDKAFERASITVTVLAEVAALFHMEQERECRRKGGIERHRRDPKHEAMTAIRVEFKRWQSGKVRYVNDAEFAKMMHTDYAGILDNEGSIKNAVSRWRKTGKSSS